MQTTYLVKQVAELAKISVRTLHYYDQIGLLKPAIAPKSGYRIYTEQDLELLQQIFFFKELGFELSEIKTIITDPNFDREKALLDHKETLNLKIDKLKTLLNTVERTLNNINNQKMEKEQLFEGFDMESIKKHEQKYDQEVKMYYDPQVVAESKRKTSRYTKEQWKQLFEEVSQIMKELITLMDRDPSNEQVQLLIAKHRAHITKYFYNCTLDIYEGLAELYLLDDRFTAYFEKMKPGFANYMNQAMKYYVMVERERAN
jgi:DNA-binding transcriptional MerR regulator